MKKLMVIGGGKWQIPLIKKAKEMGHYVVCSNLYPDSPAFQYADSAAVANVLDREENLRIAKMYQPDAVITDQSDIAVTTVAHICEKLGLQGIGQEKAALFTNKFQMRLFCKAHGFPVPDFRLCHTLQEAEAFWEEYRDIIIKPLDSQASRGVFRIQSIQELQEHFEDTLGFSNREHAILAEQFIAGTEFTIDGIMCNGTHHSLAISEKKHYKEYSNVASELYFSNRNEHFDYHILRKQNDSLVQEMGLPFGLTHAEYIWHDNKFYLVEIAARGGGTNISGVIVPIMSGIDHNELLIKMALGEAVSLEGYHLQPQYEERCCILEFFDFKPGCVNRILGEDILRTHPNVLDYSLNFAAGDILKGPEDDSKRPGHFIAWGNSAAELEAVRKEIHKAVVVEYQ